MYRKTHSISLVTIEVRIKWRYNGLDMFMLFCATIFAVIADIHVCMYIYICMLKVNCVDNKDMSMYENYKKWGFFNNFHTYSYLFVVNTTFTNRFTCVCVYMYICIYIYISNSLIIHEENSKEMNIWSTFVNADKVLINKTLMFYQS